MKYCVKCLQPDTRPNIKFLDNGLCPACNYYNEVQHADWNEREYLLLNIVEELKLRAKKKGSYFDCIIGVSGGKDSTRQALFVRDKLKLKPLLVCQGYPSDQSTVRGVDNLSNIIDLGFDVILSLGAPITWKNLMRLSFEEYANWAKSTELALFSSVPQIAIKYKIPTILWGENPGLQLGDLKTLGKFGFDGNNLRKMNTLAGGSANWILKKGYRKKEIAPYIYPSSDEFKKNSIQIIYLGWFLKDWSLMNNALYSLANGLKIRSDSVEKTGDLYGVTSLDEDFVTLNQMIKFYKYGFGRVSDYVNEEIRLGRITREEGISLVEKYDSSCGDEYIENFCKYIKIDKKEFWAKVKDVTNKKLFYFDAKNRPKKKFKVGFGL